MSNEQTFACACGSLSGHLDPSAASQGTRILCFCQDCRAVELHHGCTDPAQTGVDLVQLSPDMVHIDQGHEHLQLLQLSPRGIYRWYAGCCGTPLFNSLRTPKIPFIALRTDRLENPESMGKVVARAFIQQQGKPAVHKGAGRMTMQLIRRMVPTRLSGRWRLTPLFDEETLKPVAEPQVLTKAQRAALSKQARK